MLQQGEMFDKIYLEITNVCNLACPFCPPRRRPAGFLSAEDFGLYLRALEGFGRQLYFHVKGEPLLHPELGGFVAAAGARGFAVNLTSNGTLLAERAGILLGAKNLRKLSVSLHSAPGSPGLEAYWRGLSSFLDQHRERPAFPLSLRLWSRSSGLLPPETEGLWELLRGRYPSLGAWDSAAELPASIELDRRVFLNSAERFVWPDPALPQEGAEGFCRGLGNQIAVLVDGTVLPCCLDGEGLLALGNLRERPLAEILASPRARAIREGFARRLLVEPLCRTCGYRRSVASWAGPGSGASAGRGSRR